MIVGVLQCEAHIPTSRSLKDKRSVLNSVKGQLRSRFNVSVAEIDANETWQRATLGAAVIAEDRGRAQAQLQQIRQWLRACGLIAIIQLEEGYW